MYLTLELVMLLVMDQASSPVLPWECSFRDEGMVEILFVVYTQTTITFVSTVL